MSFEKSHGTVLVVDDEPKVIFFLSQLFTPRGYSVITSPSGESALSIIEEFPNDVHFLFLDLRMPGLDGVEVLKAVKKKYPKIPVGILTAYDKRREECLANGADFFITKPYSVSSVLDVVEQVVKKHEKPKAIPIEITPGYVASAKILVVDDEEEICALLKERLEEGIEAAFGEYKVEIAFDGREGIKKAKEFEPDIIVADIKMPHLRGDEMMRILDVEGPRPKDYIILTAIDSEEEKRKILRDGRPQVSKPFDVDRFCQDLKELCFKHKLIREI